MKLKQRVMSVTHPLGMSYTHYKALYKINVLFTLAIWFYTTSMKYTLCLCLFLAYSLTSYELKRTLDRDCWNLESYV